MSSGAISRILLGALLAVWLAGCEGNGEGSGESPDDNSGTVVLSEKDKQRLAQYDAKEKVIRDVIDRFMAAAQAGDVVAGKKLCHSYMADRLKGAKPRKFEYEIRDVLVLAKSAEVVVCQKYPDITDQNNEMLIRYELRFLKEKWVIFDYKLTSAWTQD